MARHSTEVEKILTSGVGSADAVEQIYIFTPTSTDSLLGRQQMLPRADFVKRFNLSTRDFRLLKTLSTNFEIRTNHVTDEPYFIIGVEEISFLLLRNQAIVVVQNSEFVDLFLERAIRLYNITNPYHTFQDRFVEAFFTFLVSYYNDDVSRISDQISNVTLSSPGLDALSNCRRSLESLIQDLTQINNLLEDVTDDTDTVIEFSTLFERSVNNLLDTFLIEFDSILAEAKQASSVAVSIQNQFALELDKVRNTYLRLDIFVSIVDLFCSLGAMFGGLLGMNLNNGLEENRGGLWIATLFIMVISSAVSGVFLLRFLHLSGKQKIDFE